MSKPQNPLIKILQQLGLARFLGLEPSEKHQHTAPAESPKPAAHKAPEPIVTTTVSNDEASVAKSSVESVAPVSPAVAAPKCAETVIPEDSVLKRHYLAAQQAESEALSHPYPSDSVLRRHYDTEHKLVMDALQAAVVAPIVESAPEQEPVQTAIEQVVDKAPVLEAVPPASQAKCCASHSVIPQDSVLKRHFLQCLTAEIEASLSPSPTDSVLRRHHDTLVQSELQKRLAH
ncbi:MAG: hypothetical protein RL563_2498 [Pseudomonadota bacterium]